MGNATIKVMSYIHPTNDEKIVHLGCISCCPDVGAAVKILRAETPGKYSGWITCQSQETSCPACGRSAARVYEDNRGK